VTPEQAVKQPIQDWLLINHKAAFCWPHYNGAISDAKAGIYRKPNSRFYRKGVSDIVGLWYDAPLVIETKVPGYRATDEQIDFLTEVAKRGGIAILAYSLDDVLFVLGDLKPKRGICYIGHSKPRKSQRSLPGF
jgi:hypothetical protein